MKCQKCGKEIKEEFAFCQHCGSPISHTQEFLIVTTPSIPGYKIKKVLGVVTGLTPRTRGVLGKFVASFQSMLGGEVTAFTTELEKARIEAMDRIKDKAKPQGANAITGLDLETSDLGLQAGVTVISSTGTAVIVEPER
ncbi:MAG: heavy metal-binding domain-containing protein [Candidatus Bathyarchaeia archaeon]